MASIADCLRRAVTLAEVSDSARLDVELLLAHVLGESRTYLFTWPERELSADAQQRFDDLLARRQRGEPIAYLVGEQEFWSLPLAVAPYTLIPRPDTETLVEATLERLPDKPARVLDLGTGTGAVALALASERSHWQVVGTDCVPEAVELARRNAARLGIANARFVRSDWFADLTGEGPFDAIVSNPPYIEAEDEHLTRGDLRFEPASALVAGTDGLDAIRTIIGEAPRWLSPGGWLAFEHGWQQAGAVQQLLQNNGFTRVASARDLAGQWRVTYGCTGK